MSKTITFQDVAKAAGVSVATVSRIVRGSAPVSPELEARVRASALTLGINLSEHGSTRIAGFLLCNRGILHAFHSRVMLGAEEYFAALDYNLMFLSLKYDAKVVLQNLHMPAILQRRGLVCGYILAARISPNLLEYLSHNGIPLAVCGNHVLGEWQKERYDVVWFDDTQGAYELTRYLLSLGHQHIWFIGHSRLPWVARRSEGYRRAMTEVGLPVQISEIDSDDYFELGYLATKSALNQGKPLTAILAGADSIAQGANRALNDSGLQVPQDVSLVGFDDIEAPFLHPPLTTVAAFPEQIGKQLAQMLLNRIAHPDLPPQSRTIPTRLVKRESHRALQVEPERPSEAPDQVGRLTFDGADRRAFIDPGANIERP
jgi:DNA-binding LacI/PurR family transcriptional regulator